MYYNNYNKKKLILNYVCAPEDEMVQHISNQYSKK